VVEGVSGGDLVKESVPAPLARQHMECIGRHLMWHGGLSIDYIVDRRGEPNYIDANPRLAETGNALAVGLNLPDLLVRISLREKLAECRIDTAGSARSWAFKHSFGQQGIPVLAGGSREAWPI